MLRIGSVKLKNSLVLAPMAGKTNLPFRLLIKKMGADLVNTEMVSSEGLTRGQRKTFEYLETHPDERPLSVQIFGADPERMAMSAKIIEEKGLDIVDINMGCPVKKVVKNGAGSAIMRKPRDVARIVTAVRKKTTLPLTVKIRSGWSSKEENYLEIGRIIEDCGADGITIHPRFTAQGFSGKADWQVIKNIKEAVHIPVIGSGDVVDAYSAIEMKADTGCDGVMIGRAAIKNPWIFKQILELEKTGKIYLPGIELWHELIKEHFFLLVKYYGEKRGTNMMKGPLLNYTRGLPKKKIIKGLIPEIEGKRSFLSIINRYFEGIAGEKLYED
jgi:nifR3 family TIM-barrel protein